MKKIIILIMCMLCLVGCDKKSSSESVSHTENIERYAIGDEVELGGIAFNIYKINDENNELYLLAKSSIVTTIFSDDEHKGSYVHSYEGSLVENYINEFADKLENNGVKIVASGLIDKDDLYELGFRHSDGLSGLPYYYNGTQDFISYEENFWVGGYCKYQTMSWAFHNGNLDAQSCDKEYGVRPTIVIEASEIKEAK